MELKRKCISTVILIWREVIVRIEKREQLLFINRDINMMNVGH